MGVEEEAFATERPRQEDRAAETDEGLCRGRAAATRLAKACSRVAWRGYGDRLLSGLLPPGRRGRSGEIMKRRVVLGASRTVRNE